MIVSAILQAADKACQEFNRTPTSVRLPSFLYRAVYDEARAAFSGEFRRNRSDDAPTSGFILGGIHFVDAQDGT